MENQDLDFARMVVAEITRDGAAEAYFDAYAQRGDYLRDFLGAYMEAAVKTSTKMSTYLLTHPEAKAAFMNLIYSKLEKEQK